MFNYISGISLSVLLIFIFFSCKSDDGGINGGNGVDPMYELEVTMSPDNAGSVAPDGGEYEDGEQISVQATPSGDWQFENWSGSGISSTENPITITMDKDYSITANFTNAPVGPEIFTFGISVTDGLHSEYIYLQSTRDSYARDGLDNYDVELPPISPPGAFFTGFVLEDMILHEDVRPAADRIVWELQLHRALGETISLDRWKLNNFSNNLSTIKGSLMLVDDPDDSTPNIEIDMQSASNYSISDPSVQSLFIVYTAPEPAKMITNFNDQKINQLNEIETGASMDDRSIKKGDIKITSDKNRN